MCEINRLPTISKPLQHKEHEQLEFLPSVYEGSEHSIFVVDVLADDSFCYVGWSPACERATGISSADILGKAPSSQIKKWYVKCVEAGESITYEECLSFDDKPSAKIEIIKNYSELPLIECYAGQLNQVFMNILLNAIDALDEAQITHP